MKETLHEFWSFSIIYILLHNFLKLGVLRVGEETHMYKEHSIVLMISNITKMCTKSEQVLKLRKRVMDFQLPITFLLQLDDFLMFTFNLHHIII